eukprot:CAMPEP_0184355872 /NCGR_PEP_ID=MMETSP1089-20130417/98925_1 /TAXON_ID=38269 ORGANISM="Gloeochaete wittrockiana, Strain SAG46.84" /NCGR_SAMPLE_ID=MMETSP1089 /ASSEMBLY_ACC=CAM_ASM_000445 /LENGTH=84 /DNA_ID=CAMNT_0026692801 /DNA_START=14 /DNA_END=265 /DNA_ORIENTATION=+
MSMVMPMTVAVSVIMRIGVGMGVRMGIGMRMSVGLRVGRVNDIDSRLSNLLKDSESFADRVACKLLGGTLELFEILGTVYSLLE